MLAILIQHIRWVDQGRNDRVREKFGSKRSIGERAEEDVLRWYRHLKKMSEKLREGACVRCGGD